MKQNDDIPSASASDLVKLLSQKLRLQPQSLIEHFGINDCDYEHSDIVKSIEATLTSGKYTEGSLHCFELCNSRLPIWKNREYRFEVHIFAICIAAFGYLTRRTPSPGAAAIAHSMLMVDKSMSNESHIISRHISSMRVEIGNNAYKLDDDAFILDACLLPFGKVPECNTSDACHILDAAKRVKSLDVDVINLYASTVGWDMANDLVKRLGEFLKSNNICTMHASFVDEFIACIGE